MKSVLNDFLGDDHLGITGTAETRKNGRTTMCEQATGKQVYGTYRSTTDRFLAEKKRMLIGSVRSATPCEDPGGINLIIELDVPEERLEIIEGVLIDTDGRFKEGE